MKTMVHLLLTAVCVASLWGCSIDPSQGYSLTSQYPGDVSTVAVPMWKRGARVYRRELEFRITEALVKRIQLDTPYKVVDRSKADTVLEGTLVAVDQRVLSFNPELGVPRDIELQLVVDFTWTDLRSGEKRVERKDFTVAGVYYPSGPMNEDFFEGSADAVNKLAERVVETMVKPW